MQMLRGSITIIGLAILSSMTACSTPLISAAADGGTKRVIALLDQGADPHESRVGRTALLAAIEGGHLDTVKVLLDRGVDVNGQDQEGYPAPLPLAASFRQTRIVQLLLERGADPRATIFTGAGPWTALRFAQDNGDTAIVRLLIQAEARELAKGQPPPSPATAPAAQAAPTIPTSDVDRLPSIKMVQKKHAYAVVIGIEQYREKLPKADFADRDATLMGEYLTKVLGYPEENVVVRVNDKAAKTDLEKYFEAWLPNNVEPGGSIFVYYSGHGAPNPKTGDAYLVPYDGDPTFVEKTGYPLKRLYAALDKLPAKDITVVLDSCFSGAGGRSVLAAGAKPMVLSVENTMVAGGKTVVLAASLGDQISSAYVEKGHGLLTYFFLKGLQGEGDLNKDGTIEMAELYEYVKPQVQRVARKQLNNEQTPQLLASPELLRKGAGRLVERAQ